MRDAAWHYVVYLTAGRGMVVIVARRGEKPHTAHAPLHLTFRPCKTEERTPARTHLLTFHLTYSVSQQQYLPATTTTTWTFSENGNGILWRRQQAMTFTGSTPGTATR